MGEEMELNNVDFLNNSLDEAMDFYIRKVIREEADIEFDNKNFAASASLYGELISLSHSKCDLLLKRSDCFVQMGEYSLALKDILSAIAIDNKQCQLYEKAVECLIYLGNIAEAEKMIEQQKNVFPNENISDEVLKRFEGLKSMKRDIDESFDSKNYEQCLAFINKAMEMKIAVASEDLKLLQSQCQSKIRFKETKQKFHEKLHSLFSDFANISEEGNQRKFKSFQQSF